MPSSFGTSRALVAIAGIWIVASSAHASTIIDTTTNPPWNGTDAVGSFGYPPPTGGAPSATFGQTIKVPLADSRLTSFSFEMSLPTSTLLRGYVYSWDGTKAVTEEFESATTHTTVNSSLQPVEFDIAGGVALTPGASYVLFASIFSSAGESLGGSGQGTFGAIVGQDPYKDGEFLFLNNGAWTSTSWTPGALLPGGLPGGDLAFTATFQSGAATVPEPGSLALLGAALAGIATLRKRRK